MGVCGLREGHLSLRHCIVAVQCSGVEVRATLQRGGPAAAGEVALAGPGQRQLYSWPGGPVRATDSQGLPSGSRCPTADRANCVGPVLAHCWPSGPVCCGAALTSYSGLDRSVTSLSALCEQAHLITVIRCACPSTTAARSRQHVVCARRNATHVPAHSRRRRPPFPLFPSPVSRS
jgi:hypothetical protein